MIFPSTIFPPSFHSGNPAHTASQTRWCIDMYFSLVCAHEQALLNHSILLQTYGREWKRPNPYAVSSDMGMVVWKTYFSFFVLLCAIAILYDRTHTFSHTYRRVVRKEKTTVSPVSPSRCCQVNKYVCIHEMNSSIWVYTHIGRILTQNIVWRDRYSSINLLLNL